MKIFSFKILAKDFEEDEGYILSGLTSASSCFTELYEDAVKLIKEGS